MLDMFEDLDPVNAVIVSILNDERWYGDNPPNWIISAGKSWERPSQTAAQASNQREKVAEQIFRHANEPYIWRLAQSIENCRPNRRCGSGACPECTRALQRWFVENVHNAAAALPVTPTLFDENNREILISLIPAYAATDATHPNLKWEKVITRFCEDMASVGTPWAIGGSDFSVNVDKVHGGDPVLQGQFWMLIKKPEWDWEDRTQGVDQQVWRNHEAT